jgi:Cu/Ag efflux protein CusF
MTTRILVAGALALALDGAALAQGAPRVSGPIEEVDAAQGKLTIDHGPIPNLQMEPMTMVFLVQNQSMLKQVNAGDKVRFTSDRVDGQITVTTIRKGR